MFCFNIILYFFFSLFYLSFDLKNKNENIFQLLSQNKNFKLNKKYSSENFFIQNQIKGKIRLIKHRKEEINDINNTINKIDNLFNPGSINISNDNSIKIEQTDYQPIKISEEKKEKNNEVIKIKHNILRPKYEVDNMKNELKSNKSFNLTNYAKLKIFSKSFRNSSSYINDNSFNENKKDITNKKNLLKIHNSSSNNIKFKDDELKNEISKRILIEKKLNKKEIELQKANIIINELKVENEKLKNLINSNFENNILLKKKEEKEEYKKLNEEIKILKNEQNKNKKIIIELNKQIQLLKEENNNLKILNKAKSKNTLIFSNKNLNI